MLILKGAGYVCYLSRRIHVCFLPLLFGLACVSIDAYAANSSNIGRMSYGRNGNSYTVGPVTNSSGSTIPISPNMGGWTQAGNYGVPPGASGPTMVLGGNGQAGFAGVKYPFQMGYQQPWSNLIGPALGAIGCRAGAIGAAVCIGGGLAAPYVLDWLTRSNGRVSPDGMIERKPFGCNGTTCALWAIQANQASGNPKFTDSTQTGVCTNFGSWYAMNVSGRAGYHMGSVLNNYCRIHDASNNYAFQVPMNAESVPDTGAWLPSSLDDIAPYMTGVTPDGRIIGEILSRGGEIPLPTPTVSGPTSIQGPEKETVRPDGTRVVERTTYNFSTAGNTINNTSNTTTYNTYNTGGQLTSTETTTETPTATTPTAEDEQQTQCDKYPQSLGCAELDTPPGTIPKETKNITFAPEELFGGGSCPADVTMSFQTLNGTSGKIIDWTTFCGMAIPLRALVLALAAIMAFFIIMPGGRVE